MNSRCLGQTLLIASLTLRTLGVTTAPVFNSRRRIVWALALASAVPAKPMRR